MRQRVLRLLPFVPAIALALAVQVWAASKWEGTFTSDEAIVGLMGLHTLQGRVPVYYYGQNYLGSLEAILAAGSMRLLGPSVPALRLPSVVLFGVWLLLHAVLVHRLLGRGVALVSLLVLAFPGSLVLWTSQPGVNYGTMSVLGTTALLLALPRASRSLEPLGSRDPQKGPLPHGRCFALGAVMGLGLWVHPMSVIYVVSLAVVLLLRAREWKSLYGRVCHIVGQPPPAAQKPHPRAGVPQCGAILMPVAGLCLVALVVLAFFTGACEPRSVFAPAATVARVTVVVGLVALGLRLFAISRRRRRLFAGSIALAAGAAVGNAPQWGAWLFLGIRADSNVLPSCPAGVPDRLRLVVEELLPTMWGVPTLERFPALPPHTLVLYVMMLALMVAALGVFAWRSRRALRSLVTLSPLPPRQAGGALYGLLFAIPIILAVLGANTINAHCVRFLVISWQANAVVLAVLFWLLIRRLRVVGVLIVALWVWQVGFGYLAAFRRYGRTDPTYAREHVAALEAFLRKHDAGGGYADYWLAYTLDFLTAERLTFHPFYEINRFPPYAGRVAGLPVQACLFRPGDIPGDGVRMDTLLKELRRLRREARQGDPLLLFRTAARVVAKRQHVAAWDVWLLREDPAAILRLMSVDTTATCGVRVVVESPLDGRPMPVRRSTPGERGHLIAGPGVDLPAGTYTAAYTLKGAPMSVAADAVVARLDVCAGPRRRVLAAQEVTAGACTEAAGPFTRTIRFEHDGRRPLRFHLTATGGAALTAYWITVGRPPPG